MIKGVDTFVKYLEEESKRVKKRTIKFVAVSKDVANTKFAEFETKSSEREIEISFILPIITMSDEEYLKHMEIFYHFKDLSRYIEDANLSYRETFNLVMYMLERNISCINQVKETKAINDTALRKFNFSNISSKEIDELISSGEINRVINGSDEELTEREIEIRDTLLENKDNYFDEVPELINFHKEIKARYFDKLGKYDEYDIDIIINNLESLTFSASVCDMVRYILNKQLRFRNNVKPEESSQSSYRIYANTQNESEPEIPHKEQRDAYNYIREYYNVPKKEIVKAVDYNKMLEIVSLMLKINIDLKSIRAYIRQITSELEKEENPATKYQTFKSKLAYYLSEDQIAYLDELYEAFKDDESLWMDEFMSYLDEVMTYVSETDTYNYELETAKQLLKVENGK